MEHQKHNHGTRKSKSGTDRQEVRGQKRVAEQVHNSSYCKTEEHRIQRASKRESSISSLIEFKFKSNNISHFLFQG